MTFLLFADPCERQSCREPRTFEISVKYIKRSLHSVDLILSGRKNVMKFVSEQCKQADVSYNMDHTLIVSRKEKIKVISSLLPGIDIEKQTPLFIVLKTSSIPTLQLNSNLLAMVIDDIGQLTVLF